LDGIDSLIQSLFRTDLEYGVLVINAGFAVKGEFAVTELEHELQLLNVQLSAMLKLTKAVLPKMLERKAGRILNVASVYSFAPVPFQAVYSACKAFMMSFSASLSNELKGTGVSVTTIYPGITQTAFRSRAGIAEKNKVAGMTAEAVAQIAYKAAMKGKSEVVPGFANRLFVFVARHLPPSLFARVVRLINNQRGVNKFAEKVR
jgi:short-subunit dehydrogenase